MTITASIPFLFMLLGAVLWLLSEKTGKWAELGRILFAAGAFAFAFACAASGKTVSLLK